MITEKALTLTKTGYPALKDINDHQLRSLLQEIRDNPDKKRGLLESKYSLKQLEPSSYMEAINQWQLPEGWGDFLLSLTNPIIEGIPSVLYDSCCLYKPYLILLLKLVPSLVAINVLNRRLVVWAYE